MGIENRDYYRDDHVDYTWEDSATGRGWSAVTWIIVMTAGCFVAQSLVPRLLEPMFMLWPTSWDPQIRWSVSSGAVWQLLTYAFLHGGVVHILFNMYVLHMVGRDFEVRRGSAEFVTFYLVSAVVSGLAIYLWDLFLGSGTPALGASGAVSALLMVYAFTYPHARILLFGILPMRMLTFAFLVILYDSLPLLAELVGRPFPNDNIGHAAHLGGLVLGILYQRYDWRFLSWLPGSGSIGRMQRSLRRDPPLKVHRPVEHDVDFDRQIDALLEKVNREGEASLTAAEREMLMEASRRARGRKFL
ncbi:MAG: rhomboid family intramembrane serine protease [Planctomycetaceae bacterium]|nr:rhomboid family intramembrane serine protease [Planctomycetaceae bacterium]